MHVLHIVGARPNFMKAAPVMSAFSRQGVEQTLVHTGQHYDTRMSDVFFEQLGMREPDVNLAVGSGSHARQTAEVMLRLEQVLTDRGPDWVFVYGDVNSTLAAAVVCAKLPVRLGHVEAGLRSNDRSMPEEVNRILTDHAADLLFTPSADADENLKREGIAADKVCLVGNVMIDSLVRLLPEARRRADAAGFPDRFVLVTLHRPGNVDDPQTLRTMMSALARLSEDVVVIFPVHPRTRERIDLLGLKLPSTLWLIEPLGYLDFLAMQTAAALIVTDSGGIQEESTYLGVPCLTMRPNTERPVTVELGTNTLVGNDMSLMIRTARLSLAGNARKGVIPPLWDGHASDRIAAAVLAGRPQFSTHQ